MRWMVVAAVVLVAVLGNEVRADAALCKFDLSVNSSVSPESGGPFFERSDEVMEIHYIDIDREKGRARLVGNNGVKDVVVVTGEVGLSFVEVTPSGNITVATVYTTSRKGRYWASHSRHVTFVEGEAVFSQWAGTCLMSTD